MVKIIFLERRILRILIFWWLTNIPGLCSPNRQHYPFHLISCSGGDEGSSSRYVETNVRTNLTNVTAIDLALRSCILFDGKCTIGARERAIGIWKSAECCPSKFRGDRWNVINLPAAKSYRLARQTLNFDALQRERKREREREREGNHCFTFARLWPWPRNFSMIGRRKLSLFIGESYFTAQ